MVMMVKTVKVDEITNGLGGWYSDVSSNDDEDIVTLKTVNDAVMTRMVMIVTIVY